MSLPGYAIIKISPEILHDVLNLPHDIKVVGARSRNRSVWETIDIWIESDRYPLLEEGHTPPQIKPIYRTVTQQAVEIDDDSLNLKVEAGGLKV